MIPASDLQLLRAFDGHGRIALSVFLCLETPQQRESAYDDFTKLVLARLEECGPDAECRKAIQEDIEIVRLYLSTNGHHQHAGLAIFSCAAELFWHAYPLAVPVPTQVTVGPKFDLEPLINSAA